ncbi:4-vinyl reductase [Solilutibacter silvestris]|uniref:V4R domain n=1 Tax=Solilutibacter silvestris TaxID=1645665 RepID=A0A2K1Q1C1_9GAMM|nr:4-vinyl reductase [Lysobacter silvestris]PNS08833.1 V4R domain [Lysobacter silvestris]
MIEVELRVVSSYKEGLLIALSDTLLANQFTLLRHRRANTDSGVVMSLLVKGPEANLLRMEEQLGTHHMVSSFESGIFDPNSGNAPLIPQATAATPIATAAPAAPAQPAQSDIPDQKRIEQMLPQVARDYPQVFGTVLALERSVDPAQREATMRHIGARVGAWVFKRDFVLGAHQPLSGSIAHVALPALKQLIAVKQEGDTLSTTSSPFCTPGQKALPTPQCHFFRGYLEGLLNESGHLGTVRVSESSCCARGDDCCRFEFHA